MNAFQSGATALALAACATLSGCAPMPKIEPPEKTAAVLTGVGDPFKFQIEREPTDVADPSPGENALRFDRAVRLALGHAPDLQAALARVRQAEAESQQVRLLPNPVLAVAVRFPGGGKTPDVDASVAADLLSLLSKPGRISAADQRLRKSVSESLVVVLDVLADVQQRYAETQALAAQVDIDAARRAILDELLRVTEARVKGGEASRLDVLTIQSEIATLETELLGRRSQERQARIALARLIGRPSSTAAWTLDGWTPPAAVSDDEQAWSKVALDRRPELRSVVWELAALGQEMKVARFGTLPDGGDLGVDAERSEGTWAIGPGGAIAIPLFDTGQAQRGLIAARVVEKRHELTRLERLVVQEVRVALEQMRAAKAALSRVEQRLIPLQNDRLDQAKNAYRLGLADVLAVRGAEQDLQRARSRQVELQEQFSQASFQLTRAAGGIAPAELSAAPAVGPTTRISE